MTRPDDDAVPPRLIGALVGAQVGLHAGMSGLRVAAPLALLQAGGSTRQAGVLLACFAVASVGLALPAGRLADRFGYHRPVAVAVGMVVAGALLAVLSQHIAVLCVAALLAGGGANVGLICIQRSAGRLAATDAGRLRVFGWLGLAPALANGIGPVLAGAAVDAAGWRAAFALMALLPLAALALSRRVPAEPPRGGDAAAPPPRHAAWTLLRSAPLRRLLIVNWLVSASWDLHGFVLPVLGHARGLSASTIGVLLGLFAFAVAGVRLAVPLVAGRLRPSRAMVMAMAATAVVFAVYPLVHAPWAMGMCAASLGLALGAVQPMVMVALYALTPPDRHGEALALRSMTLNASSITLSLLFGLAGAAVGAGAMFWIMGAAVAAGCRLANRIGAEEAAAGGGG